MVVQPVITRWRYAAIAVLALGAAALVSHADASIFGGNACVHNPSAPDFNRNGICETILHSSSVNTPIQSTSSTRERVFTSGNHVCSPHAINCTFSVTASGTISFTISGNAGFTSLIGATVGFSAGQSFSWSAAIGNAVTAPPGTTWFYWIDATGRRFSGNYNAEFWEMNVGWQSVGRHSYGSWTARNFTSTDQGWRRR